MDCFHKLFLISKVVDSLSDSEVAEGATELLRKIHKNIVLPKPRSNSLLFGLVSLRYENMFFIRVTRNPWTCDIFTLGAYSYPTTRAKEGDQVRR